MPEVQPVLWIMQQRVMQKNSLSVRRTVSCHLQLAHPEKRFYALSKDCVCHNMKMTTLGDVYNCVVNGEGESITLTEETMQKARKSIDAMLRLG